MRNFLNTSDKINHKIKRLNDYCGRLESYLMKKQSKVMSTEEENSYDKKIEALNSVFMDISNEVKDMIRENIKQTQKLKKEGYSKTFLEIRELHTFRHRKDLSDVLSFYQNIQWEFKNKEYNRLKETYLISNPNANDEDLKKLEEGGDEAHNIILASYSLGSKSAKALYEDVKERSNKIEKIKNMIKVLVSLIEEIDQIVTDSDKVIDDIYLHVASAEAYTSESNRHLMSALAHQISLMKWKRIFYFIILILIIILVLIFIKYIGIMDFLLNR